MKKERVLTLGFRYRLHAKAIAGKPDLLLPKYKAVIFVHGCFWHRHPGCRNASTPSTRPEFWAAKFAANVARDSSVRLSLLQAGWRVATVWECALRTEEGVAVVQNSVSNWLLGIDEENVLGSEGEGRQGHHSSQSPEEVSKKSVSSQSGKHPH